MGWKNLMLINSKQFKCGYCNSIVATKVGYISSNDRAIYICPHCDKPTFFEDYYLNNGIPSSLYGENIKKLPDNISSIYDQARSSFSVKAYSGSVMLCRKLIMNVAVDHGAKKGLNFVEYVDYLDKEGYIPRNSKEWVNEIRKQGNIENHEIELTDEKKCIDIIDFTAMLLKMLYEYKFDLVKKNEVSTST
jgi:hypothetical protein